MAVFPDVVEKAADTTRFSVFVSGLSNGWAEDKDHQLRRKTLQLNFKKIGDEYHLDSREIHFVPPAEWIYRKANLLVPKTAMP